MGIKLTKEDREFVKAAMVRTLAENFPSLNEAQVEFIAEHFKTKMCPLIAKMPSYEKDRTFGMAEMRDAFATALAARIIHGEQPTTTNEGEEQ